MGDVSTYLSQIMEDLAVDVSTLSRQAGVSDETVRRWKNGTRPRPRAALSVARAFPPAVGAKLLTEWGYSSKPLEYTEESEPHDPLLLILAELKKIRMVLQQPEPIPWKGETE